MSQEKYQQQVPIRQVIRIQVHTFVSVFIYDDGTSSMAEKYFFKKVHSVLLISHSCPANTVWRINIVVLITIGIFYSGKLGHCISQRLEPDTFLR